MSSSLKRWLIIGIAILVAIPVLFLVTRAATGGTAKAAAQTAQVSVGDVQSQVLSSASLAPAADLSLTFGSGGTITSIKVQPGDKVTKGQALLSIDATDLQLAVTQAQASLSSAQAKLDQTKEGTTAQDLANAEDTLKSAQAKLTSLQQGPTAYDLANAQASLDSAKAKLASVLSGSNAQDVANAQSALTAAQAKMTALKTPATAQDIANAQSALTSAKAKLQALKDGPTATDLAIAKSNLKAAQAKLDALKAGPTASDVAAAQANLKAAQLKYDALKAGPTQADISAAQAKVTSAQTNLAKTQSSSSLQKQSAQFALNAAANAVRDAQDKLVEARIINVPHKGTEPILNPDGTFTTDATQTQIDTYNAALRAEQDAEANMQKANLALSDAQLQEIQDDQAAQKQLDDAKTQLQTLQAGSTPADLAAAQSSLQQAQTSLDKLMAPPANSDLVSAQASVDQAQNNLTALQAPPTNSDLVSAQAAVDQAQNNLDKLKLPATATDITQAQAAIDQAQNNLIKAKAPPTDADIKAAQAGVTSAQAALDKLKAPASNADVVAAQTSVNQAQNNLDTLKKGPLASDLEVAQASVDQAKASLQSAQAKLAAATLTAPFAGVVTNLPVTVGQNVTASTAVVEIVDNSLYHLTMNVGEADITKVKVNQPVDVTFDALSGEVYTGTITFVSPSATVQQGVVSYNATVTIDPKAATNSELRPGMSATAAAIVSQAQNVLLVPNRAVRTEGRQKVVYVLGPNDVQIRVPVTTGISDDTNTQITGQSALQEGDQVVIQSSTATSAQPAGGGGLFNFGGGRGGR